MINPSATVVALLLTALLIESLDFDEKNADELCFVCHCSDDQSHVDCSGRGLTALPDGFNDKVTNFNASNNDLTEFPTNLERYPNLTRLDLSGNQMNTLAANAFRNLEHLEILNLSRNSFSLWLNLNPNDVLVPAKKLRLLDLSQNKFSSLGNLESNELFVSASLEALVLEGCSIDSIHGRSPISGLTNIKILRLSNNPLRRIQNLISPSLRSLDVSHCQLSFIYHDTLMYLPALINLQMSHNYRLVLSTPTYTLMSDSLKYLDISYCNIMQPSIKGFSNLRKAVLSHNLIRFLERDEFNNSTKLEYLDLSYNSIGNIKKSTFNGLTLLRYLDLSWNEIATVPEDAFSHNAMISQINLSRNYITRVGHLKSISLKTLDMSQCEISIIGKDSLEGLQSLIDLNLARNLLSHIPDTISSNTLQYLNLDYNRINSINNFTFFMLPRLQSLSVIGNRFTTIWNKSFFQMNPYIEKIEMSDNMWRCDCKDSNMYDFYEFLTLEPSKKEESYNLVCNSPNNVIGQTWFEACYFTWFPSESNVSPNGLIWFLMVMIVGLSLCFLIVSAVRSSMKRRLAAIQAERERQVDEARDRLRQLRIRAEQEALCNTPDPRDLIAPPSYDEALSMPKLNTSCHSLNETGTGKSRRKRGRRKTKSSGDLLDETERNGEARVYDDFEMSETPDENRRERHRRRAKRFGSHEIAELEHSPGARRRRMSQYDYDTGGSEIVTIDIENEHLRPLRPRNRRYSIDDDDPRESDF